MYLWSPQGLNPVGLNPWESPPLVGITFQNENIPSHISTIPFCPLPLSDIALYFSRAREEYTPIIQHCSSVAENKNI